MSNNKQTHGFCETPHEKCTMNYCDENGCMNRKRNIVGEPIEMSNNKQTTHTCIFEKSKTSNSNEAKCKHCNSVRYLIDVVKNEIQGGNK